MAMAADEVWASPSTLTGSIGVYGLAPRLHESLAQVGVHTDGVGTTTLSGQFDLTRPMEPEIERIYRASVAKIYEDFISIVSEARNRPPEDILEVAGGRVWSGAQALDAGLVDRTGTLQEAIESAGRIAGLGTDFSVEYEESELSTLELFLLEFAGDVAAHSELFSAWNQPLARQIYGGFQSDLAFLGRTAGRLAVMAHCWCRIE
jgi:protease-4